MVALHAAHLTVHSNSPGYGKWKTYRYDHIQCSTSEVNTPVSSYSSTEVSYTFLLMYNYILNGKTIPVTGREGP
jgi:hypothetical protein